MAVLAQEPCSLNAVFIILVCACLLYLPNTSGIVFPFLLFVITFLQLLTFLGFVIKSYGLYIYTVPDSPVNSHNCEFYTEIISFLDHHFHHLQPIAQ